MTTKKELPPVSLSARLEDLQGEHSSAAEVHVNFMRMHENKLRELAIKISAQEKLTSENEAEKIRLIEEKKEAQKLLAMVKRQFELQQAEETKQNLELIRKLKEEREMGEVLAAEKIAGLEEKIVELEEKLISLEIDLEFQHDLVHTLRTSLRQLTDEIETATSLVLCSDLFKASGTSHIRVKMLGELNTKGWYEVCGHKFKSREEFMEWTIQIDQILRTQEFPLKCVPDGNNRKMKFAVDEDDKWLTTLRNDFGPIVADSVGAAALEIENWNSRGRLAVPMLWDYRENKRATMSSIFEYLHFMFENEKKLRTEVLMKHDKLMIGLGTDSVGKVLEKHRQLHDVLLEKTRVIDEKDKQVKSLVAALQEKTKEVEEKDKQLKAVAALVVKNVSPITRKQGREVVQHDGVFQD